MSIYEKLLKIQGELSVPKAQYNEFGGYNYRNNEDILNAVKPLLQETKTVLIQSDEMVQIGERYYIKATSSLIDANGNTSKLNYGSVSNTAYARETESKKKSDESQLTGAASSYARKYSLNGLLAIDDSRDADTTNKHEDETQKLDKNLSQQEIKEHPKITTDQALELDTAIKDKGYTFKELMPRINKACGAVYFNLDDITTDKYDFIKTKLEKLKAK